MTKDVIIPLLLALVAFTLAFCAWIAGAREPAVTVGIVGAILVILAVANLLDPLNPR